VGRTLGIARLQGAGQRRALRICPRRDTVRLPELLTQSAQRVTGLSSFSICVSSANGTCPTSDVTSRVSKLYLVT